MRRRKRQPLQSNLQVQQSKIIFNNDLGQCERCRICSEQGNTLISPCECSIKYHQKCLLIFIKGVIRRELRENDEMDLNTIKCKRCDHQFHIHFTYRSQYNCRIFMKRMEKNCCNKHITVMTFLIVVIIITVVIYINYFGKQSEQDKKVTYGLIALIVVQSLILLIIISHFIQTYLLLKQIILQKVTSLASNNSDDNKISDDCQIIVRS